MGGQHACVFKKKPTKNKPAITTTLIYSQCFLMPTQNSPICLPYITNLFEEPQIGALFYRTEWQRRPTDIHLRRWKALQPPPPPATHTIIPAHRSNSCVSADCTLSRAHDQETT